MRWKRCAPYNFLNHIAGDGILRIAVFFANTGPTWGSPRFSNRKYAFTVPPVLCGDATLVRIGHLFPRRFFGLGDERFGKRVEFECTDVMEHRFFGEDRVWVANPHANQGVVGVYREFVKEGLWGDILCNDIRQSG